jgi:sugar phosphate isomerase/epimerase
MKPSEIRHQIRDAGMGCESSHYQFRELREHVQERIDYARELGLKQMIVAALSLPRDAKMADWERAATDLNRIGEQTRKAGIQLGFHNHNIEFKKLDGVLIYDRLMSVLDPSAVKMQFQVAVASLGIDPVGVLDQYPGRIVSLHLQDWSPVEKKLVAVGQGSIPWSKLFAAAKKAGVQNYFVELDLDAMKASYAYLHRLDA